MKTYDIAVIGAGIHGVAVALEAARQGYSVAVIERRENSGLETSSASSKLIHGGLRYLETGEIKLVYECLRERRFLLKHYPDLVALRSFILPVYKTNRRPPWKISLGLFAYWLLSGLSGQPPFFPAFKKAALSLGLNSIELSTAFRYFDAQTDDQKLTRRLTAQAKNLGAKFYFNCTLNNVSEKGDGYSLCLTSDERFEARIIVNAGGPWVNNIAEQIPNALKLDIDWVQGTHIVIDKPALQYCVYCESPRDHRAVFVLPWQGKTMIGTTEKHVQKPNATASEEEIEYLLEVYNQHFPDAPCSSENIINTYCGIRVLPKSNNNINKRSRDTILLCNRTGSAPYIAVYGGKLTSHRATAKKVLKKISRHITKPQRTLLT